MSARMPLLRPATVLVLIGLAAAVTLAGLDRLTGERIERQQQQRALSAIAAMLPERLYDNALLDDSVAMRVAGLPEPATVYRAYRDDEPVAAVIDVTTPQGYSGDIRLLIAVDTTGEIIGVRVLEHRETPGLGDRIERRRSAWIEQFSGRSLDDPAADGWAPDRREGEFDTLTSATITSAAVTDAVRRALEAFESQATEVFEGSRE